MLNSLLLNMYVGWLCDTDSFSQLGAAHLVGYLSCHMWALLWNGSHKTLIKFWNTSLKEPTAIDTGKHS